MPARFVFLTFASSQSDYQRPYAASVDACLARPYAIVAAAEPSLTRRSLTSASTNFAFDATGLQRASSVFIRREPSATEDGCVSGRIAAHAAILNFALRS